MRTMLLLVVVCLGLGGISAAALDVTSCGEIVPAGQAARLAADLDCPSGAGIVLGDRARLYLDGHVLSGSPDSSNVVCQGPKCKIVGPGEIVGGNYAVTGEGEVLVSEATIRDQIRGGIDGIASVRVRRVTMTGIGFGHPSPSSSEVIRSGRLRGPYLEARNNAGGISSTEYRLRHATITDNGGIGIGGPGFGRLSRSTVTGNLGGALGVPIDVFGIQPPKLYNTVCDHSYNANNGGDFGICQLD